MASTGMKAGPDLTEAFRSPVSRPPSAWQKNFDVAFKYFAHAFGAGVVLLLGGVVFEVMRHAKTAIADYGLKFLTTSTWDANRADFGILPEILGTLYTSILALALGGFLGITVPLVRGPAGWLNEHFESIPFFSTRLSGPGILPASIVLSIMILPTVTAISREAMAAVPKRLAAAAYGLGATRWEVIFNVTLPTSAGGIFGALVLGFGRALGETMALAMLVGNANVFGLSLFSPGNTLAALLANHFPEAGNVEVGALMYAALVLMLITLAVNALGSWIMLHATHKLKKLG